MNINETLEERLASLQEVLLENERKHDLWVYPPFQEWVEDNKNLIETLDKCALGTVAETRGHLAMLGLEPPVSQEESLRLYIALRAVVNFWTRKLKLLESQSSRYEQTKKEINELGRNSSIGTIRSVAQR